MFIYIKEMTHIQAVWWQEVTTAHRLSHNWESSFNNSYLNFLNKTQYGNQIDFKGSYQTLICQANIHNYTIGKKYL